MNRPTNKQPKAAIIHIQHNLRKTLLFLLIGFAPKNKRKYGKTGKRKQVQVGFRKADDDTPK
jgi:hypothetical protein